MQFKYKRITGAILLFIGTEGVIADIFKLHIRLNFWINLILMVAGAYLILKQDEENNQKTL